MGNYFLTKTELDHGSLLRVGGEVVLDDYERLRRFLLARVEPSVASVLAEPVTTRTAERSTLSVVWYGNRSGVGQALSELDDDSQRAAGGILRRRLAALLPLTADREEGARVSAALSILDPESILVVDGDPVLVNWGVLPLAAQASETARQTHFERTLGPFLAAPTGPEASASEITSAGRADPPSTDPPHGLRPRRAAQATGVTDWWGPGPWAFLPLAILLLLAAGTLVWLLRPGTRLFPPTETARPSVVNADKAQVIAGVNASLEQRIAVLREAVASAVCTPDGTLLLPDGRTPEGLLPPPGGWSSEEITNPATASPQAASVPDPARIFVSPTDGAGTSLSLQESLEARTVLVLSKGSGTVAAGAGFFVGPDLAVTSYHVIQNALGGGEVYVANKMLNGVRPAELVTSLGPLEELGGDYALLRVPNVNMPVSRLRESTEPIELQNIFAAGYYIAPTDADANYTNTELRDRGPIPSLIVTDGIVTSEQNLGPETRAILHTAPISRGNSGGPLVDMCGRVIGINTLGRANDGAAFNFALASTGLLRFLRGAGVSPATDASACEPRVSPTAPPARAAEAASPGK